MAENPLALRWVFGFNKEGANAVQNLSDGKREAVFYFAAHTGVIFDFARRKQRLLQGHTNAITATAVSQDKRWIVTADSGADSMLIVWDSLVATPIRTLFAPHPAGLTSVAISHDSLQLATLSQPNEDGDQEIAIWDWTSDSDVPVHRCAVATADTQRLLAFHPSDPTQLVSTGETRVVFWSVQETSLKFFSPPLSAKDFKIGFGKFVKTIFIPDTTLALTSTKDGEIVVWDNVYMEVADGAKLSDKRAVKIVRLHNSAINELHCVKKYIVTGGEDGFVRFFDLQARLVAWYEDIDMGPIASMSFEYKPPKRARKRSKDVSNNNEDGQEDNADESEDEEEEEEESDEDLLSEDEHREGFHVPSFVLATADARVVKVTPITDDERDIQPIVSGNKGAVCGMTVHPSMSQLALLTSTGHLQIWDYAERSEVECSLNLDDGLSGTCLAYNPNGDVIAAGFSNGALKLIDAVTMQVLRSFRSIKSAVTAIKFAPGSEALAISDADNCVGLYRIEDVTHTDEEGVKTTNREWVYVGRHHSHSKPIIALLYHEEDGSQQQRLTSIGQDRRLVEYDVDGSSITGGLVLKTVSMIEQSATPTACSLYPGSKEDVLLTANDQFKFKLVNANTRSTRKTLLCPTYGGPITHMETVLDSEGSPQFLVYACAERVIGLVLLPLDGNPNAGMGMIAHPGRVHQMAVTHDGKYVVTTGGDDFAVNVWAIKGNVLRASAQLGGQGMEPFVALIEGGRDGEFYREMLQYFYYAQLHSQGEDAASPRKIEGTVPIEQVPNIMRAVGFYPTHHQIDEILNEIKYSQYLETGQVTDRIDFDQFLRVYVNHRPVHDLTPDQFARAFRTLSAASSTSTGASGEQELKLDWETLLMHLQRNGERINDTELSEILVQLGHKMNTIASKLPQLSGQEFAEKILGFTSSTAEDDAPDTSVA